MLLRDATQCYGCWEVFFVGEMQQKQAIWCLKRKSLNINALFIELLYKINITFVIMHILKKKQHSLLDFNYVKRKYIHVLPHILNFAINLNAF